MDTSNTYTKKEKNMYLIGMMGQNIIYSIIAASLGYYMQFTILIPALTVGIIMTVARVWDAFNDFMMGTLVDKTRSKWGKCRPYLIFVPLPIMIATILCFTNFGFYGQGSKGMDVLIVIWAAFTYILYGMIYTVGDIPLWGVTALMTDNQKDRDNILAFARIAGGIGGGIAMLAMQPLSLKLGKALEGTASSPAVAEKYGFLLAATILAVLGSALFQVTGPNIKERIQPSEKKYTFKENFQIMFKNKPFTQILFSGILGSPKMLLALVAMPLITYYFASKDPMAALIYMVLLGGGMFLGQFIVMFFVPTMLKKTTKKKLYNFANLMAAIPYLLIFIIYLIAPKGDLVKPGYLIINFFIFFICGASFGITNVLQSTMIADAVDYEEYKNGTRPDGVFFAGQTFIAKLTTGIATILSAIAYAIVGFSDAKIAELNAYIANMSPTDILPRYMPEYEPFMMILFFLVSIPPAIGCILSVIPTWNYALDDDVHKEIMEELKVRRAEKELENEVIQENI